MLRCLDCCCKLSQLLPSLEKLKRNQKKMMGSLGAHKSNKIIVKCGVSTLTCDMSHVRCHMSKLTLPELTMGLVIYP